MKQPQLFETEDQYGNDIIQGPKLQRKNLLQKRQWLTLKIQVPLVLVGQI